MGVEKSLAGVVGLERGTTAALNILEKLATQRLNDFRDQSELPVLHLELFWKIIEAGECL